MSHGELTWLASEAKKCKLVIEIGSWYGRSSRAIADNLPRGGKLICVDHWDGSVAEKKEFKSARKLNGDFAFKAFFYNMSDLIMKGKVIPLRMSSKNAAPLFPHADMVFIDGGHTYEEVKEDIKLWQGRTPILCGHDYNRWEGVNKAVDELVNEKQLIESIWLKTG